MNAFSLSIKGTGSVGIRRRLSQSPTSSLDFKERSGPYTAGKQELRRLQGRTRPGGGKPDPEPAEKSVGAPKQTREAGRSVSWRLGLLAG